MQSQSDFTPAGERERVDNTLQGQPAFAKNALPDIADINARNRKFWAGAAGMEEYTPNQAGTINNEQRLTVAPKLDMGAKGGSFTGTADQMPAFSTARCARAASMSATSPGGLGVRMPQRRCSQSVRRSRFSAS